MLHTYCVMICIYIYAYNYIYIHLYVCIRSSFIPNKMCIWLRVSRLTNPRSKLGLTNTCKFSLVRCDTGGGHHTEISGMFSAWPKHYTDKAEFLKSDNSPLLDMWGSKFPGKHTYSFKIGTSELDVYVARAWMMICSTLSDLAKPVGPGLPEQPQHFRDCAVIVM